MQSAVVADLFVTYCLDVFAKPLGIENETQRLCLSLRPQELISKQDTYKFTRVNGMHEFFLPIGSMGQDLPIHEWLIFIAFM